MKKLQLIKMTLVVLLLTACGGTGLTTVDDEKQAGTAVAQQVEEQIGIYPAEFLTAYVDAIGRRLVTGLDSTPYTFYFKVIDKGEPNAFATGASTNKALVAVRTGLVHRMGNKEVQAVCGHERSHVALGHIVKIADQRSPTLS